MEQKLKLLNIMASSNKLEGVFESIPSEVYHHTECPGISSTSLKTIFKQSVGHYKALQQMPKEKKDCFEFGTAAHSIFLENLDFETKYIEDIDRDRFDLKTVDDLKNECIKIGLNPKTSYKKKDYVEILLNRDREHYLDRIYDIAKKEFERKVGNRTILKPEKYNDLKGMLKVLYENKTAMELRSTGKAETSFFSKCKYTDIVRKCRPDWICNDRKIFFDYKTTEDASENKFSYIVRNFLYDMSIAYYSDIIKDVTGEEYTPFLIVQEKKYPYAVITYKLSDEVISVGREIYTSALNALKDYKNGELYQEGIHTLSYSPFFMNIENR